MAAVAAVTMVAPLVGSIAVGATPAFATNSPKLVFTTQQSAQILQAGQSFAVQVEVQDGSAHVITSGPGSTDSVGLAFNTYAPGVSLNCNGTNDTVNAVNGVANFSCNVTVTGDYFLGASDNTPGDIQTAFAPGSVEIIPGPATQLTFTGQPENAAINVAFPVEVTEADQYRNAEETSGDQIGLALGGGTAGAVLTCTPDGSSTPSNGAPTSFGVVDFTCSVDTAGVGYYLTATDPSASLGPVQSSGFDIGQESAAVTASPAPGVDVNGVGNFNVTFTVLDASGNAIANRSVSASADGATGSTTTDANGSATIALSCPGVPGSFEVTAADTTTSTVLGATQESCVDLGFQGQDPIGQSDSFSLDGAAPNSPVTVSFAADANSTRVAAALSSASCSTDATGTLAYGSCYYTVPSVPGVTAPANVIALVTVGSATYQDPSFLLEEATTLQLTPSSGPPGSHIAYSVTGFAANEIVDISVGPTTYVSRCTTDPSGSCSGPLTVPSMPAGTYTAEADGETSGSFADSPFTVTSQLTLSPVSGAPGSTVAASVAGFGSNETVGFTFAGTIESSTCMTDSTGSCSTGLTVPVGASGPVTVTATGASSGDTANAPYTVSAVQLSPATGPVGTPVQVTAVGFSPSETVDIFYNSLKQTTCTASPSGSCSATITVPAGKAGNYTVIATGETSGTSVRTTFQEVAALVLTPDYGPPDSTFGANATGFLAGETVNLTVDGALRNSCTADGGGSCSVTLGAPAGGPAAAPYTITATGATSGLSANATFTEVGAQIALSPSSGPGGTTVQVAASYFQAHETVSISFDSVSAGVCTTDGSGACSTSINASPLPGGTYTVTAVGSSSHQVASASFAETPTVSVSPSSGPSGAPFQETASGFAANDTVAFSYGGSPAQSCQADSSGDCTAIVTVPAGEAGTYTLTGTGTSGLTASTPFTQTTALTLTPALGAVGTTFQALAYGYQTGETVNIDFNGTLVRACQTGTDGTCLADVTVPQLPAATYQVTAVGQTTQFSSSASFTVVPLVTLTPSSGIPGAPYTASMSGFSPNQNLYVYFGSYFAGSCAGDVTGSCSVNATVPAGLSTAIYNVQADDTTSGQSASASFDVIPGLALSPASGAPGTTFSAVATGFWASDKIFFEYGGAVVGSCTTGSSAGCTLPIQVPSGSAGPYTVLAFDGTRNASATFDQTAPSHPALALTPSSGTPGGSFDASLSGFAAGESVSFTFDGQSLNTQCSTDASGTCTAVPLNAPASLPAGSYDVVATGASNDQASATFQIEPALSVVPASGEQGSAFTATASGFAAGESVSFTFDGNSIPGNCQTDTSGDCTAGLNVPNGIAAGPYVVTATGGTSSLSANATYTETGSLQLAPASGSPGSSFTANAVGFAPSETVNFSFDGTTLYESCNTDSHGDCSATGLSVPNGLAAGQYIVAATGATSGDVATATYTIVGSLALTPSSGTPGGSFDANLSGFAAGESVSFTFDGQSLNTQCSTDASGSCTAVPLTVPASLPAGSYDVVATGATSDQASATFQIEPALSVVPASGQQGSAFSAIASGFGAGESVSFTFDGSSIPGGCVTDASGDCTAGLNVPNGIAGGGHVVTATGGTSGLSANATYTELPSLNVGPSSGSPGSPFTAYAVGFARPRRSTSPSTAPRCTSPATRTATATARPPASPYPTGWPPASTPWPPPAPHRMTWPPPPTRSSAPYP